MILVPTTPGSPTVQSSAQSQPPTPKAAVAPTPTPAPKQEITPEMSALMLKATKLERELEKKTKEGIVTRRSLEGTLATERKTWAEKLKDADELAAMRKEATVNPLAVARKLWGEKAYETLTQAQLNGGAPSAESVTLELDKRTEALKADFDAKLKERDEQASKARESETQQRLVEATERIASQVKAAEADFPLVLKVFGSEASAAQAVMNRIRTAWNAANQDGNKAPPMDWKTAAEQLEAELFDVAQSAASHEKYASKLKERLTPAQVSGVNVPPKVQQPSGSQLQQPSRKTLSNDLTASTQARPAPARNDEERQERMLAAYDAARKARET